MHYTLRHILVRRRPGHAAQGLLSWGGRTHVCALGKGGVKALKREGDGATPLGSMRLVSGWYRPDHVRLRSAPLGLSRITDRSGWCDGASDRNYNRPVTLPYPASHETMKRPDHLYDLVVVLDFNLRPRRRGGGSAIFLHAARAGMLPTEGCVALPLPVLTRLLPHLSSQTVLTVLS
jgi:L,D-peptidoglycan transpeptidase YkuD (ErfK/YbiS/YcfS/YnhG family)